jgi:hypothetical protein
MYFLCPVNLICNTSSASGHAASITWTQVSPSFGAIKKPVPMISPALLKMRKGLGSIGYGKGFSPENGI